MTGSARMESSSTRRAHTTRDALSRRSDEKARGARRSGFRHLVPALWILAATTATHVAHAQRLPPWPSEINPAISPTDLYAGVALGTTRTDAHPVGLASGGRERAVEMNGESFLTLSAGTQFRKGRRVEIELGYRSAQLVRAGAGATPRARRGGLEVLSAMVNVFQDVEWDKFVPVFSLGAGVAQHRTTIPVGETHATFARANSFTLAWQGMAKLGYRVSEAVRIEFGYRYLATTPGEVGSRKLRYRAHAVEGSVKLDF